MGQLMWVRMLPGYSTDDANGGVSTAEPGMGNLKANIRGCDWSVNAIQWERLHASAEYIPEGMMKRDDDQVPAHRTTKYPK
jgi:hypothetical protein